MAGRDPPVLIFHLIKTTTHNFAGPGRQPGDFVYSSKQSHQKKDVAALGMTVASAATDRRPNVPSDSGRYFLSPLSGGLWIRPPWSTSGRC